MKKKKKYKQIPMDLYGSQKSIRKQSDQQRLKLTDLLGTKKSTGTTRHYCYKCGMKKQERFMQPVSISVNNRIKWQCLDDCLQQEHRRYGRNWNYDHT